MLAVVTLGGGDAGLNSGFGDVGIIGETSRGVPVDSVSIFFILVVLMQTYGGIYSHGLFVYVGPF